MFLAISTMVQFARSATLIFGGIFRVDALLLDAMIILKIVEYFENKSRSLSDRNDSWNLLHYALQMHSHDCILFSSYFSFFVLCFVAKTRTMAYFVAMPWHGNELPYLLYCNIMTAFWVTFRFFLLMLWYLMHQTRCRIVHHKFLHQHHLQGVNQVFDRCWQTFELDQNNVFVSHEDHQIRKLITSVLTLLTWSNKTLHSYILYVIKIVTNKADIWLMTFAKYLSHLHGSFVSLDVCKLVLH